MVSMRSGKPICTPPRLSGVSPVLPYLKQFQCWSDWWWLFSHPFKEDRWARFLILLLSPPGDWWCDIMSLALCTQVVSQDPQHFRHNLRRKPPVMVANCPPVYLLCHFPSLRHVQDSAPTGVQLWSCLPKWVTWILSAILRFLQHSTCINFSWK